MICNGQSVTGNIAAKLALYNRRQDGRGVWLVHQLEALNQTLSNLFILH